MVSELLEPLDGAFLAALERHERDDRLARERVGAAAHGGLGDAPVIDERRLDLDRRDAVTRDVHHVVDATEQPEVAVLVDARAVSGEIHPGKRSQYVARKRASSPKIPRVIAGQGRFSTR